MIQLIDRLREWISAPSLAGCGGLLALALLAGCSAASAPAPTLQPALEPIRPAAIPPPGSTNAAEPAPTVAAPGADLPGRLLLVQNGNLWLWQGASGRQLTHSGDAFQPAWSPDAAQVAFVRRAVSGSDIMLLRALDAVPEQITSNTPDPSVYSYDRIYQSRWAFYPAWSPDATTLAFASQFGPPGGSPAAEYRMSLYTVPTAGGRAAQAYGNAEAQVGRPAYTPDGASIVFALAPVGEDPPSLYRYHIATDRAEPLPGALQQSYDPAFSADGRWLAFAARAGAGTDIFVMPADGGTATQITHLGSARAPAFAPDGSALAFLAVPGGSTSFDLWVAGLQADAPGTLKAGEPRQITHDMHLDADSGVAWGR